MQPVSCCCPWYPFKLADQAHPWLDRGWVSAISGTLSSLLSRYTLGSAACELLLYLAPFQACWSSFPWLCSMWVAAVPGSFQACWPNPLLALQKASVAVLGTLSSLLTRPALGFAESELLLSLTPFNLADQVQPWLCSRWVAVIPEALSILLRKFTLGFAGGELPLSLGPIKLAEQAHSWLCREWVTAISGTLPSLLSKPTLGSAVCELLLSLAPFQACWSSPLLAL